ncbi:MAG: DM13 domain-containing protein [Candidatus Paceibacterota bacterium]
MSKKIILGVVAVVIVGVGSFLLSPLWRNVALDEALPQAQVVKDNMETMDSATKERFMIEVEAMKDNVMVKEESMPVNAPAVQKEASLVARAHDVKGKALLVQSGDQYFVRFEDLKTINGPDLRIYLSTELGVDDAIDLGEIRATEGNVNYIIPTGTDVTKYHNVLIWCRAFGVLFSYADLSS